MSAVIATPQAALFDAPDERLPPGLRFAPDGIDRAEEAALLALAAALPLQHARYHQYTARRRVHVWEASELGVLPAPLQALRDRLAHFAGVPPGAFVHAMLSEYRPGTPLGWHRDAPMYGVIVGVSLGGPARLRLRPWPAKPAERNDVPAQPAERDDVPAQPAARSEVLALDLAPRSVYVMQGPARWAWQHSVAPVPALRHSVTLRTGRACVSDSARADARPA